MTISRRSELVRRVVAAWWLAVHLVLHESIPTHSCRAWRGRAS
jgi:hypothetical protein